MIKLEHFCCFYDSNNSASVPCKAFGEGIRTNCRYTQKDLKYDDAGIYVSKQDRNLELCKEFALHLKLREATDKYRSNERKVERIKEILKGEKR